MGQKLNKPKEEEVSTFKNIPNEDLKSALRKEITSLVEKVDICNLSNVDWAKVNNYEMPEKKELFDVLEKCKITDAKVLLHPTEHYCEPSRAADDYFYHVCQKAYEDCFTHATFNGIALTDADLFNKIEKLIIKIDNQCIGSWNKEDLSSKKILSKTLVYYGENGKHLENLPIFVIDLFNLPIPLRNTWHDVDVQCFPDNLKEQLFVYGTHIYIIADRWAVREIHSKYMDDVNRINHN